MARKVKVQNNQPTKAVVMGNYDEANLVTENTRALHFAANGDTGDTLDVDLDIVRVMFNPDGSDFVSNFSILGYSDLDVNGLEDYISTQLGVNGEYGVA